MEEKIITKSKKKQIKLVIYLFLMVIGSGYLIYLGFWENKLIFKILGILAGLFFGIQFIIGIIFLFKNQPVLKLRKDGIEDCTSKLEKSFIPYTSIVKVRSKVISRQRVLEVYMKESKNTIFIDFSMVEEKMAKEAIDEIKMRVELKNE